MLSQVDLVEETIKETEFVQKKQQCVLHTIIKWGLVKRMVNFIHQCEMNGPNCNVGYRQMWRIMEDKFHYAVKR